MQDFSVMLKVLVDHHYQPTASSQDKDEARAALEAVFDNLIQVLEQNSADTSVIERSKTLRSMMFKLYKEARQSSRLVIFNHQETSKKALKAATFSRTLNNTSYI